MNELIKITGDISAGFVTLAAVVISDYEWALIWLAVPSALYASLRCYEWITKRKKRR